MQPGVVELGDPVTLGFLTDNIEQKDNRLNISINTLRIN